MTPNQSRPDLDGILCDFETECPMPTPADVARWQSTHPGSAAAIAARAAWILDPRPRTFAECIAASGADDGQKAFWLGIDAACAARPPTAVGPPRAKS